MVCQGGRSAEFLLACDLLHQNTLQDQQNGIIAIWHDESHWNRFLHHRSDVKILPAHFTSRQADNVFKDDVSILLLSKEIYINYDFWRSSTHTINKQPKVIIKITGGLGNQIWQYMAALALYGQYINEKKENLPVIFLDISWYNISGIDEMFLLDQIFPEIELLDKNTERDIDNTKICHYKSLQKFLF